MSLTRKVTSGLFWLAFAQVARRLSGLVITAVLARLLTPGDFGLIALTMLAVQLVAIFGEMGITSALVQRTEVSEAHLNAGFWLNVGAASGLAILGVVLAQPVATLFHEPRLVPLLRVMMVVLPINALGQISDVKLQRALAFRQIALIEWVASLVAGVLGMVLAFTGWGVWALVAQTIAMAVVLTCGRLMAAGWVPSFTFQRKCVPDLFSFSISVIGCSLINYGAVNVDNAVIGGTLGTLALGYYMLAYNLVMMPGVSIGGLMSRVMFPALASVQTDLPRLRRAYLRMLRLVATVNFPLIVGLAITAPLLIQVVYGPQWDASAPLLRILAVWGAFQTINLSGVIFYAIGKPNILLYYGAFSLLLMTLSFVVGVRWGVEGVAWACAVVSPIVCLGPHVLANRLVGIPTKTFIGTLGPPFIAASVMGAVVTICVFAGQNAGVSTWPHLALCVGIGAVVYALAFTAVGILSGRGRGELANWFLGKHLGDGDIPLRVPLTGASST